MALSCEDDPLSDLWKPKEWSKDSSVNSEENKSANRSVTKVGCWYVIIISRMGIPKKIHMMK